jgi:hypothetical protein
MTHYRQRAVTPDRQVRATSLLWTPPAPEIDAGIPRLPETALQPRTGDLYAVIDDLTPGQVKLVLVPWPRVDVSGRLVFRLGRGASTNAKSWRALGSVLGQSTKTGEPLPGYFELFVSPSAFQHVVDRARNTYGQIVRDLRIGDAFRLRGIDSADVLQWEDLLDVTAQAREAAKTALLGAVAPKLAPRQATEERLREESPPPPPPPPPGGQVAGPAV